MDPLAAVLVLLAVGLTLLVILTPLGSRRAEADEAAHEAQIADLEAAKEARYREIREAEMDYRTGKLSEADWRVIDRQLRAEAVELLRKLDALGAKEADDAERPADLLEEPTPEAARADEPATAEPQPVARDRA